MELSEIELQLRALRNNVGKWVEVPSTKAIDAGVASPFFQQYARLLKALQSKEPSLFDVVATRKIPKPKELNAYDGRGFIQHHDVKILLSDIDLCLDLFPDRSNVKIPSLKVTSEGMFFAGQYFDAIQRISELLASAHKRIVIIDGYVDENLLRLLTSKAAAVEISILTKARSIKPALLTKAAAFNKQYGKLSIRTSEAFHDRFIIIDDQDFYHLGPSIDQHLGKRGFMFSRIEEPIVINALRTEWSKEWATAPIKV